jgi:hypothetical protein
MEHPIYIVVPELFCANQHVNSIQIAHDNSGTTIYFINYRLLGSNEHPGVKLVIVKLWTIIVQAIEFYFTRYSNKVKS